MAPLVNDQPVCVRLRGVFAGGVRGPASEAVCFTPAAPPAVHSEPEVAPSFAPAEEVAEVSRGDGGAVTLSFTYTLSNRSGVALESIWLRPWDLPAGTSVVSIVPVDGAGEIVTFPWIPDRWYWSGANLGVFESKSLLVTVEVVEVQP